MHASTRAHRPDRSFFDPCMIGLVVRFSRARQLPIRSSGLLEKKCGAWPSDASQQKKESYTAGKHACMHGRRHAVSRVAHGMASDAACGCVGRTEAHFSVPELTTPSKTRT